MTQREALYKAWDLARINTHAEIHILTDSDELLEEYVWTAHRIMKVELGLWAEYDGRIIIDENEMREELETDYGYEFSDAEVRTWMSDAILIYTRAG